tara:strand:+ start:5577 stop:6326 length:750 start_codon:yes stop_codon:yes gene_type:complete
MPGGLRNIVTMKWGDRYPSSFVNRLYNSVSRNLGDEFRFFCFTDNEVGLNPAIEPYPLPSIEMPNDKLLTGWRKLSLFGDDMPMEGECLFLDLDIVITGNIDPFFTFNLGKIPIIHNWVHWRKSIFGRRPEIGNSSVFRWEANKHTHVMKQYLLEKDWALDKFSPPQSYLTHCIRDQMVYWPESWVKSFKRHCRPVFPLNLICPPKLPTGTRIVAFHGKPDPDEALVGFKGKRIHHHTLASNWIRNHWQ